MTPITKQLVQQHTPQEDLNYRATLIAAGEELSKSPNLQRVLQDMFDEQLDKLLRLRVGSSDEGEFAFRLAHNNVQARLETLELIWNYGFKKNELIQEYQQLTQHMADQQNYEQE